MNKYKSKYKKPQSLPQYGWGSTIGGIAGGALGTLLGPFGTTAGSSLGAALGNAIDGEENTQGNQIQMPQLNIDPVNTQQFYNPVKAYGGQVNPNAEIEGNEVMQHNPNQPPMAVGQGNMQQIASDMSVAQGPTHANGGVPISAAPGSMVVSDRLPAPNTKEYKSIANKVEMLGRKKGQLEKKIERNPNDKIAKDTIGLVQKQIDTLIQQQEQMKMQNANCIMNNAFQKAYGGITGNEQLSPEFLNLWNTGSYAYGGGVPTEEEMYPGITNEYRKNVKNIQLNPDGTMNWGTAFAPQANGYIPPQQSNTGSLLDYSKPTDINNQSGQNMSKTNLTGSEQDLFKTTVKNAGTKKPFMKTNMGSGLQYAAQYIPDIIASFTKKDKPIDPNMYMNQSRVNAARYDTSAEEAAVQDARSQAMLLAKESSGGDAGMYANMGNVANTGAYKNLGQVYNRAQNINMQNQMAADQANAGIEGQNRSMALNIANMNQADASAVEDRRMAGMQGIANKLANQYSQDRQFKLLKDIAPHYNYNEKNGELTFNGKKYYGEEAKTLLEQLKMNASNAFNKVLGFGQNLFGGI